MLKYKAILYRELAAMTTAGVNIMQAIKVAAQQCPNSKLKQALLEIPEDMKIGYTLADAMSRHPDCFDNLDLTMLQAGELSGYLEKTLNRLAKLLEDEARLKNQIKSAFIYPIVVIVLGIIVSFVKQIFLVPTIYLIFIVFAVFLYYQRPIGRLQIDGFLLKMPILGEWNKKASVVRVASTLGMLAGSGVPIINSLDIVRDRVKNRVVANAVEAIKLEISQGRMMSNLLQKEQVFPPTAIQMISIGEETGELNEVLLKVSSLYAEEVEQAIQGIKKIIEPLLIFIVGGIGGLILPEIFPQSSGF
jgi:type IV pilus assembly protein PilC